MCEIFGQLSPSGSRQFFFKTGQPCILMRWREDGRSGKDVMLGQSEISRLCRLERNFRFVGRDSILQRQNSSSLTDERFAGSSNETDGSLQERRTRYDGTLNPSAMSMWLSNTELLTVSASWTRNCEMNSTERFRTSVKCKFWRYREDKPLRKHRSGK